MLQATACPGTEVAKQLLTFADTIFLKYRYGSCKHREVLPGNSRLSLSGNYDLTMAYCSNMAQQCPLYLEHYEMNYRHERRCIAAGGINHGTSITKRLIWQKRTLQMNCQWREQTLSPASIMSLFPTCDIERRLFPAFHKRQSQQSFDDHRPVACAPRVSPPLYSTTV